MEKVDEVRFLMAYYERLRLAHAHWSKAQIDKEFCTQVEKLIRSDDISREACNIVTNIFDIVAPRRTTDVAPISTPRVTPVRPSLPETDPCSPRYSGSSRGGC